MSLEGPNWSEELVSRFLKNVLERAEPDRKAGSKGQSAIFCEKVPGKGPTGSKGQSAVF